MYRGKRIFFPVILAVILLAAFTSPSSLATTLATHAPLAHCGSWQLVASPNQGQSNNALQAVAAVSAADAWAVGDYFNTHAGVQQTLIEQWNGTTWQVVASPNTGAYLNELTAVAAISSTDVWAVGYSQNSREAPFQTLIEHWDGTGWSVVPGANTGFSDNLSSVSAVSSGNIWAVGVYYSTFSSLGDTMVEHWNGSTWSIVKSPGVQAAANQLLSVTAISSSDVWAVGEYTPQSASLTLIEHWNGTSWKIVKSPNPRYFDDLLFGVAATSASDVWAVGTSLAGALTEHWNGQQWSLISTPAIQAGFVTLSGVATISANNVWAVGNYGNYPPNDFRTLIEQWNGAKWQIVASKNRSSVVNTLSGVAAISAQDIWAVGDYKYAGSSYATLIEHFC